MIGLSLCYNIVIGLFYCVLELVFDLDTPDIKAEKLSTFLTSFEAAFKKYLHFEKIVEDTKNYVDDIWFMTLERYEKLLHGMKNFFMVTKKWRTLLDFTY